MPEQMSYSGQNSAVVWRARPDRGRERGGPSYGRATLRLATAWNLLGAALLANIVTVAILSTPRFAFFGSGPERLNVWVMDAPFVWLPAVMVLAALAGHLLVFRALKLISQQV
jgi:hypothetical protein